MSWPGLASPLMPHRAGWPAAARGCPSASPSSSCSQGARPEVCRQDRGVQQSCRGRAGREPDRPAVLGQQAWSAGAAEGRAPHPVAGARCSVVRTWSGHRRGAGWPLALGPARPRRLPGSGTCGGGEVLAQRLAMADSVPCAVLAALSAHAVAFSLPWGLRAPFPLETVTWALARPGTRGSRPASSGCSRLQVPRQCGQARSRPRSGR